MMLDSLRNPDTDEFASKWLGPIAEFGDVGN
jgi:hypothetical protein